MKIKLEDLMKIIENRNIPIIIWNNNIAFGSDGSLYEELIHDYGALNVVKIHINSSLITIKIEDNTDGIGDWEK